MSKTEVVRARMEPQVKRHAEAIFRELGLNTTEAITLFYKQVTLCRGLPFPVRLPTEETARTLDEVDAGTGLVECDSAEDMFNKLGL